MTIDLGEPDQGCLLMADITGYTEYMAGTELMHAQDVVADLLETIVASIEPPFRLSKLEGDAAFAYANQDTLSMSMMMDTVESAYFAFQKRLRDVVHSTTCECNACLRIPSLDLKFFVHNGEYVVRRIARSEELTGSDVILVHRLAKGTSGAVIAKPAYAVYTKATFDAMAMDPSILGFRAHTETFSDIGDVDVYIQDLAARWAVEQERNRDYVTSAEAVYEVSFETPAPAWMIWDAITDPAKRLLWQQGVTGVEAITGGRQGVGSVNHCMHGPDVVVEHVADWRPFSYLTLRYDRPGMEQWAWTYQLDSLAAGTRLSVRVSDPGGEMWSQIGDDVSHTIDEAAAKLEALLGELVAMAHV
ncbi:MAG TPA: DUF2652 domain-containing protein [Acidimicrobiia bacterium]|nr:DUF2652 domain-containing protein [Acidimicrobiia bacterium]